MATDFEARFSKVMQVFFSGAGEIQRQQQWLDLQHCDLTLRLYPSEHRIKVSCDLTAEVIAEPATEVVAMLGIPGMNVFEMRSLAVDDRPVEWRHEPPFLRFALPLAPSVGQTVRFGFVYDGIIDSPKNYVDPRGCELMGEGLWLPIIAFPMHQFTARTHLDTPAGIHQAFTGHRLSEREVDGRLYSEWETEWPVVSLTCICGPFWAREEIAGGVNVRTLAQPDYAAAAASLADMAAACLRTGTEWFGPLPLTEVTLVQPIREEGGEYAHMPFVVYALGNLPLRPDHDSLLKLFEATGHELGHFWWGNIVGSDIQYEAWLSEGFADFTKVQALESAYGRPEAVRMMRQMAERTASLGELPPLGRIPASDPKQPQAVRRKGGLFLEAMRELVGDETMNRFLRAFFAEFRGRTATTALFVERATALIANPALPGFLQEHLYGTPTYAIDAGGQVVEQPAARRP